MGVQENWFPATLRSGPEIQSQNSLSSPVTGVPSRGEGYTGVEPGWGDAGCMGIL